MSSDEERAIVDALFDGSLSFMIVGNPYNEDTFRILEKVINARMKIIDELLP